VDSSTQAFWLDEMTLMQSEFGKEFLMKVVGNHLIFPPIKFRAFRSLELEIWLKY
jgi:hypothetical protein